MPKRKAETGTVSALKKARTLSEDKCEEVLDETKDGKLDMPGADVCYFRKVRTDGIKL